jgi:ribosomal protein S21
MTQVVIGENEGLSQPCDASSGKFPKREFFPDMRKHRHFETPLEKQKRKAIARRTKRRFHRNNKP